MPSTADFFDSARLWLLLAALVVAAVSATFAGLTWFRGKREKTPIFSLYSDGTPTDRPQLLRLRVVIDNNSARHLQVESISVTPPLAILVGDNDAQMRDMGAGPPYRSKNEVAFAEWVIRAGKQGDGRHLVLVHSDGFSSFKSISIRLHMRPNRSIFSQRTKTLTITLTASKKSDTKLIV